MTGATTLSGALSANGNTTLGDATTDRLTVTSQLLGGSPLVFQGATDNTFTTTFTITDPTADRTITFPNNTGTVALSSNDLSVFAATTSVQLAGVISDETGTGALVFGTSPTLVTPVLGVATGTSLALSSTLGVSGLATFNVNLVIGNGATSAGTLTLNEDTDDGTNKLTIKAPALASDYNLTLPINDGDANQVLTTDGSGILAWGSAGSTIGWTDDGTIVRLNTSSDFVGIGTSSPTNALQVAGNFQTDARGPEKVTNGTFTTVCTPWTLGSSWSCGAGLAEVTIAAASSTLTQETNEVSGESYEVVFTLGGTVAGSVTMSIGGVNGTARTAVGTYTETIAATGTSDLTFTPNASFTGTIDNVSVKKVTSGNAIIGGTLAVTGTSTLTGNTTVGGTLGVTGISTLTGAQILVGNTDLQGVLADSTGNLTITDAVDLTGALTIIGATTIRSANTLTFNNSGNTFGTSLVAGSNTVNLALTLPIADGVNRDALITNGSGVLSFARRLPYVARAATSAAGTLASSFANASVIDGVTLATGDTILIKDQTTAAENGLYTVNASGAPTLIFAAVTTGTNIFVISGTTNANRGFYDSATNTFSAVVAPSSPTSFSSLVAATATNTIDNLNFAQTWNWSTATTQNPLTIAANALTTGTAFDLTTSNASLASTNGFFRVANTAANSGTTPFVRLQPNSITGSGLTLTDDGNVGIGTTSPSAQLNLKGSLSSVLTGTVAVTNASAAVTGTSTLFTTELAVGDLIKIGTEIFTISVITSNTSLTLDSNYLGTTAPSLTAYRDPTLFAIDNGDAVSKLIVTRSGNVGIGTTTPGAKLEVAGSSIMDSLTLAKNLSTIFYLPSQ